ncbi:unnamed protein product [Durusdinium trenchii]|uniref:Aminotransferase class V domain-containing protein n=1 Tax=Durusdinium trenchii TaxID=1381693 RepID=A0ABP0P2V3_9DINO
MPAALCAPVSVLTLYTYRRCVAVAGMETTTRERHAVSQHSGDERTAKSQRVNSDPFSSLNKGSQEGGTMAQPLKISDWERDLLGSLLTTDLCERNHCAFHRVQTPLVINEELCWIPALGGDLGYGLVLTRAHKHSFADYYRSRTSRKEDNEWIEACRLLTQQTFGGRALLAEHGGAADDDKGCSCVNHAHLHIFPLALQDADRVEGQVLKYFYTRAGAADMILQSWEDLASLPSCAYNALSFQPGKLLVWTDPAKVRLLPSQFVRRALNDARGWPVPEFDWRAFPKLNNHIETANKLRWAGQFVERTASVLLDGKRTCRPFCSQAAITDRSPALCNAETPAFKIFKDPKVTDAPVYRDGNATTPIDPRVLQSMVAYDEHHFGNASSAHTHGSAAEVALRDARQKVALLVGADPSQVIFVSGATEARTQVCSGSLPQSGTD